MTGAMALKQPAVASRALSLFDDAGGEPTLEEMFASVWEGLTARSSAVCPLCDGRLVADYSAQSRLTGGRCERCGTRVS
jgi:hypothetical protein